MAYRGIDLLSIVMTAVMAVLSSHAAFGESAGTVGFSGMKKKAVCGKCHEGAAAPVVTLEGPNQVESGSTNSFKIVFVGRSLRAGGFNVAASDGTLAAGSPASKAIKGEVTHVAPLPPDSDGLVTFEFDWTAPKKRGTYTLFGAVASVNGDRSPKGDGAAGTSLEITVGRDPGSPKVPPVARFSHPDTGVVDQPVFFNANDSVDSDGAVTSYHWDFGDGGTMAHKASVYTYKKPGRFTVTLTVTDDDGLSASAYSLVTIRDAGDNKAPVAKPGGPYSVSFGEVVKFDASQSKDPDGTIVNYHWDFGDGYSKDGPVVTHVYTQPGLYVVQLTVTDDRGLPGSATIGAAVHEESTAFVSSLDVPSAIFLGIETFEKHQLKMRTNVNGLKDDARICGRAFLERNGIVHREQLVCFQGRKDVKVKFDVTLTTEDVPAVKWNSYVVLDNGKQSPRLERQTKVEYYPLR